MRSISRLQAKRNSETTCAMRGWRKFFTILIVVGVAVCINTWMVSAVTVIGTSMYPTYGNGDICILIKCDVTVERYSVVKAVVDGQPVIKRVIGLPGDTLQVIDGRVYINGEAVASEYDFYTKNAGTLDESFVLAENEYFLLGDNRADSYDSRYYGAVIEEQIKGVVIAKTMKNKFFEK